MNRKAPIVSALVAALAVVAAGVWAQGTFGRLLLTVTDEDGNPLAGVRVTATCEELPSFKEEKVTNKGGRVTLAFGDATRVYDIQVEYEGFPTIETTFKPTIRKTAKQTLQLDLAAGAAARMTDEAGVPAERSYTLAERIFNQGVEALQAGDYQTARARFLEALEKDPGMTAAHSALGAVYVELGEHAAALESARLLLAAEPENPRGYRILYEAHSGLGQTAEAEAALAELARLDWEGDTSRIVYNEGVEAVNVGDTKRAEELFRQALELEPELAPALSALAILQVNKGAHAEAAATAERLLVLRPDDPTALRVAFEAYRALGQTDRETRAFERLVAVDPRSIAMKLFESGVDRFNGGDVAGAAGDFERALQADASLAKAHYYLGLCMVNRGDAGLAREHFEQFLAQAPDDPDAPVAQQMLSELGG